MSVGQSLLGAFLIATLCGGIAALALPFGVSLMFVFGSMFGGLITAAVAAIASDKP